MSGKRASDSDGPSVIERAMQGEISPKPLLNALGDHDAAVRGYALALEHDQPRDFREMALTTGLSYASSHDDVLDYYDAAKEHQACAEERKRIAIHLRRYSQS